MAKKFYIGKRVSPELKDTYFIAYGQITKKEAEWREDCIYGELRMTAYNTKSDYLKAIADLRSSGKRVSGWSHVI